jgi:hypothetical protein
MRCFDETLDWNEERLLLPNRLWLQERCPMLGLTFLEVVLAHALSEIGRQG